MPLECCCCPTVAAMRCQTAGSVNLLPWRQSTHVLLGGTGSSQHRERGQPKQSLNQWAACTLSDTVTAVYSSACTNSCAEPQHAEQRSVPSCSGTSDRSLPFTLSARKAIDRVLPPRHVNPRACCLGNGTPLTQPQWGSGGDTCKNPEGQQSVAETETSPQGELIAALTHQATCC